MSGRRVKVKITSKIGGLRRHRLRFLSRLSYYGYDFRFWYDADDAWYWGSTVCKFAQQGGLPMKLWCRRAIRTEDGRGVLPAKDTAISDDFFSMMNLVSQLIDTDRSFAVDREESSES